MNEYHRRTRIQSKTTNLILKKYILKNNNEFYCKLCNKNIGKFKKDVRNHFWLFHRDMYLMMREEIEKNEN